MSWVQQVEPLAGAWFAALADRALEATLLALLALAVAVLGRRLAGPLRYGLLVVALLKFLLPPIGAPWSPARLLPDVRLSLVQAAASASPDVPPPPPARDPVPERTARTPTQAAHKSGSTAKPTSTPSAASVAPSPASRPATEVTTAAASDDADAGFPLMAILLVVQVAGALLLLVRHLAQRLRLARLARRCVRLRRPELEDALRAAARRQGLRRVPELVASPDRLGPAAAGLLHRRVVLPVEIVDGLPADRLAPILEHEIAHHRRLDLWTDLLVLAGALVWWPNPVYWLVSKGLRRVREDCCDAAALATVSRDTYCHCLLDVAALLGVRRPTLPALAHGSLSHPLGRRIRHIMSDPHQTPSGLSTSAAALLAVVALLLLPSGKPPAAQEESSEKPPAIAPAARVDVGRPDTTLRPVELAPVATSLEPGLEPAPIAMGFSPGVELAPIAMQEGDTTQLVGTSIQRHGGQSLEISNRVVKLSSELIDVLVERGLDRDLVESFDGVQDRRVSLAELREWNRYGVEAALPDELAAWGFDGLYVSELVRLVWAEADAAYLRSLRELDYGDFDLDDVIRLARYEVVADWIKDWDEAGYDDLDADDLIRLRRYEVLPAYAAAYQDAGYDLSVDDLVRLHRYEVDQDAVKRLAEAGLADFSVDDLVRLKRYEVSDDFVRAMTEDGAVDVSVDDLVRLKRYEVSPDYVAAMRDAGVTLSTDDLVRLQRYGVEPELPRRLADLGYDDISTDDLVRLQRYGVDLDYVPALETLGMTDLAVDDLITLQRYDVDLATIRALAAAGYQGLSADEVVKLHRYEVSADYIRAIREATSRTFSVDELVQLERYEVDADYVRGLTGVGFGDLEVADLVKLKRYEVTPEFIQRLQEAGFEDLTVDKIIRLKRAAS